MDFFYGVVVIEVEDGRVDNGYGGVLDVGQVR